MKKFPLIILLSVLFPAAAMITAGCSEPLPPISIISGIENQIFEPILRDFESTYRTEISMEYRDPVNIMLALREGRVTHDAVWPASSLWLELGNSEGRVEHITSIMTSPVVFAIRRNLAEELGFVGTPVRIADILTAIEAERLSFMMPSATQTSSGAIAYLGFLSALTGTPDVLTMDRLRSEGLEPRIRSILEGVHRSSGSSEWLKELMVESNYDAMVNYETLVIEANRELLSRGREPLYVLYPADGTMAADFPLGFIDRGPKGKEETFLKLREFLLTPEVRAGITAMGNRTPEGSASGEIFNPDWGIETGPVRSCRELPAAEVTAEAFDLYQILFRKPSLSIFCLDYSENMRDLGIEELHGAMRTLLDQEEAGRHLIQTGEADITVVMPFSSTVRDIWTVRGNDPDDLNNLLQNIIALPPQGPTDIYTPVITGLNFVSELKDFSSYIPAILLMTDGESNEGRTYTHLWNAWNTYTVDVPVFSIMFGAAVEDRLEEISSLTRGRVFDGREDPAQALRKAKGYN
ncbi:MAG: substrate-binding domain-containing protein [Spirochaetia bacterium]